MIGDDMSHEILATLDGLADRLAKATGLKPSKAHASIVNMALINTARHYGYEFALGTAKLMPEALEGDKRAIELLAHFAKDDVHAR